MLAALLGLVIERLIIRPMIGEPLFSIAVITLGLEAVLRTHRHRRRRRQQPQPRHPVGRRPASSSAAASSPGRDLRASSPRRSRSSPSSCSSAPHRHRHARRRLRPGGGAGPGHLRRQGVRHRLGRRRRAGRDRRRSAASMSPIGIGTATAGDRRRSPSGPCRRSSSAGSTRSSARSSAGSLIGWPRCSPARTSPSYTDTLGIGYQLIVPVHRDADRAARQTVRPVRHAGRSGGCRRCAAARTSTPATQPRRRSSRRGRSGSLAMLASRCSCCCRSTCRSINQLPLVRFLGDADWIRLTDPGGDLRHRRARAQPAHRRRRPGVARPRLLHGRRRVRRRRPRRRAGQQPVGPRAADVDLAARRRHHAPRWSASSSPRPRSGCAGSTSASSPSAWCSSASTCRRLFPEISGPAEVGRDFPPLEFKWWKEEEPVISFADDGHWLWFDITGNAEDVPVLPRAAGRRRAGRQEPHPHPHRPGAAGDPRPRRRRRGDGRARGPVQADRLRHLVVLRRHRRGRCSPRSSAGCHPSTWDLILSVEFIAILLIGGAGTIAGHAARHVLRRRCCPRFVEDVRRLDGRAGRRRRRRGPAFWDLLRQHRPGRLRVRLDRPDRARLPAPRQPRSTRSSTARSSSSSCCSSRSGCTASGSRSATTGRDGRSRY